MLRRFSLKGPSRRNLRSNTSEDVSPEALFRKYVKDEFVNFLLSKEESFVIRIPKKYELALLEKEWIHEKDDDYIFSKKTYVLSSEAAKVYKTICDSVLLKDPNHSFEREMKVKIVKHHLSKEGEELNIFELYFSLE